MDFVAKTRMAGTSLVITIPKVLGLKKGETYQFNIKEIKNDEKDMKIGENGSTSN